MSDVQFTPWFPASEKPARVGVYQRRTPGDEGPVFGYGHWNGEFWGPFNIRRSSAKVEGYRETCFPDDEWRGLAQDPNVQSTHAGGNDA